MCGGCGGGGGRDWASAAAAGPAGRAVVAATAAALCRAVGDPTRVCASSSGWLVSSATGATTVAATTTALWAAVPALPGRVAAAGMPGLDEVAGAPAAPAAPAAPDGTARPGGRRVAVLVGRARGPEEAWADAAVEGDDPLGVVAGVDASPAGARVLVHCASDAAALTALGALAAPGPAQRSATTAVVARGRPGHPWADDLDRLDGAAAFALLDGAAPPARQGAGDVVARAGAHPAAAACWGAAALAAGRVRGSRTRLVVGGGRVVVDLLDRIAVGLRPLP